MANVVFTSYLEDLWNGAVDVGADTISVALIDTTAYTVDAADQFLSDVPGAALIGTAATLGSITTTAGVLDAGNASWTGLSSAPAIGALLFYMDTGVAGTSRLMFYVDQATGLPTAAGLTSINAAWNAGGIATIVGA